MKAPVIYVVVRRGEFSAEVGGWSFDKRDAEDSIANCERCRWR